MLARGLRFIHGTRKLDRTHVVFALMPAPMKLELDVDCGAACSMNVGCTTSYFIDVLLFSRS